MRRVREEEGGQGGGGRSGEKGQVREGERRARGGLVPGR